MLFRILFFTVLSTSLFSQSLEKIATIQMDTFQKAHLSNNGHDFMVYGGSNGNQIQMTHIANLDGTNQRESPFTSASNHHQAKKGEIYVRNGKKAGFVDQKGEVLVPPEYDYLPYYFKTDKVFGQKGEDWYLIDLEGNATLFPNPKEHRKLVIANEDVVIATTKMRVEQLISLEDDSLSKIYSKIIPNDLDKPIFRVKVGLSSWGIFSLDKGEILEPHPHYIVGIKDDYIEVGHRREYFTRFYNFDGTEVDSKGKRLHQIAKGVGYITVKEVDGKQVYGFCDENFKEILPEEYKRGTITKEGFIQMVFSNHKALLINQKGKVIIDKDQGFGQYSFFFKNATDIHARKRIERKTVKVWFDQDGNQLLKEPFLEMGPSNPYYGTKNADEPYEILCVSEQKVDTLPPSLYLYNREGELLSEESHDSLFYYTPSLLLKIKNKKMGLMNKNAQMILPVEFDQIAPLYDRKVGAMHTQLLRLTKDGQTAIIDLEGNTLLPLTENVSDIEVVDNYLWLVKGNEMEVYLIN